MMIDVIKRQKARDLKKFNDGGSLNHFSDCVRDTMYYSADMLLKYNHHGKASATACGR